MRATSLEAWQAINDSGQVPAKRLAVYNWLFRNGPAIAREVNAGMRRPGDVHPSYHKRLSELEHMGLVATDGERACSVTGRTCIVWRTTDSSSPKPYSAPPASRSTRAKLLDRALSAMSRSLDLETRALGIAIRRELVD